MCICKVGDNRVVLSKLHTNKMLKTEFNLDLKKIYMKLSLIKNTFVDLVKRVKKRQIRFFQPRITRKKKN